MDLDRGVLARVDRKLLAGLGQDERFQMVRVPVSPAKWSTWRRYCESVGVSMSRAIVTLIDSLTMRVVHSETTADAIAAGAEGRRVVAVLHAEGARVRARGWIEAEWPGSVFVVLVG